MPLAPIPLADGYVDEANKHKAQKTYPMDLYLCDCCGHVQLLEVIPQQDIYVNYLYETRSSITLGDHFYEYAQDVLHKEKLKPDSLVVDIGSNDATLLHCFKECGLSVLGVEPAMGIAKAAAQNGIPTENVFFGFEEAQRLKARYGTARLVTVNNLLANVDDLDDFIAGVKALLASDGIFVFESFYLGDFIQNTVFDFAYHEHLSYFAIFPLEIFLKKHELKLVDLTHTGSKGGSLRFFIQHEHIDRRETNFLHAMRQREAALGLRTAATYAAYMNKISAVRAKNLLLLRNLHAEGKTIAAYGASATTTMLLYHFGLDGLIEFFVDDYPVKIGRYTPGLHIPVLAPEMLYEKRPDYVYIAAWRYAALIMKKHNTFSRNGGTWIVPLPDLRILSGRDPC